MATCPRCLGPLSEGHHCRPVWIRRVLRQVIAVLLGAGLGGAIQLMTSTVEYPVLGIVIGGLLFFGLFEAIRPD